MASFKYKTRGNSEPQGKPRVYFCCHPIDFDSYFESISDDILAKQNCTIWYSDEAIVRDEDFFADLKQMQLFVMPVTTNLLCTENETLDKEFKFAIENHIPVLPLLQEKGLEELFNKKCGDLQFLDKNNTDITAISYDEKLKKYLESVLIGDELAEKIRAAFDAYVFLSYRKKDRKYAQELMRLIHKNEFCRDIAIWYDEFLIPGENFNDSIKDALQKSDLFVLAVTPNLVNEPNYIMTTEYPMAKQERKPILPTELVPTDKGQLSEKYEDIPKPADALNEAEFSEALLASMQKIAVKENDGSPEHNFFIGLAYLGGIDVEVDYDRATELIKCAAASGLPAAIKKLSIMYQHGEGVKINYGESLKWQHQLVSILFDIFTTTGSLQSFLDYYMETEKYVGDLYNHSDLHRWGATKVICDLKKLADTILVYLTKEHNDFFEHREEYDAVFPLLDRIEKSEEFKDKAYDILRRTSIMISKFFSKSALIYHDIKFNLSKTITKTNQVAYAANQLAYAFFSEYAGDIKEAHAFRNKAKKLIINYANENGKDGRVLYEQIEKNISSRMGINQKK